MSSTKDRFVIFPSQANLGIMKNKLQGALRGLGFLQKKRDALIVSKRQVSSEAQKLNETFPVHMRQAVFALTRAKFLNVDLYPLGIQGTERATMLVESTNTNVAGVQLPTFHLVVNKHHTPFPLAGLGRGGQQLILVRDAFQHITKIFIELASLLYAERALTEAIQQISMRSNALEHIIIPKFRLTVAYIRDELDEFAREEFYRMKKAQSNKKNKIKAVKALLKKNEEKNMAALPRRSIYRSTIQPSMFHWEGIIPFSKNDEDEQYSYTSNSDDLYFHT